MKKQSMSFIFMLIVTILLCSGNSLAADPGITKDSIKIGLFAPLSGPYVLYGTPHRGALMQYNEVNKKGGIHGRKLEIVLADDKCSGPDLVAVVKKLVTKDQVFMLHGASCSSAAVSAQEYITRVNVPWQLLNASGDQLQYPPIKNVFGHTVTQHAVGGSTIEFMTEYLKAKKIAWICHNDAYGSWGLVGAEYQLKAKHPEASFSTVEKVDRDMTDATAVALKVKSSKPDAIVLAVYDRPGALLTKALYELGVKVPMILLCTGSSNVFGTFEAVGAKEAFANWYFQDVVRYGDDGKPGPEWARKMFAENYPELNKLPDRPTPWMFQGISSAALVCKALEGAGPNPTREKVIAAYENIKDWEPMGIMAGKYSYGPDDHTGEQDCTYFKFDGEKVEPIAGSYEGIWKYGVK